MALITSVLATLVALEFFFIMYLETIATTSDLTSKVFGMDKRELARKSVSTLFKNQGVQRAAWRFGHSFGAGQGAVILPGFHVGDGAIIGANSVVGSDVESYAIVVGKPRVDLHRTRIPMKAGVFDAFNHIQEQYF